MMDHFEYKVIPAPRRGVRAKGAKTAADKFANALQTAINELSARGWEYVRAESLPSDERHGLTMRKTETYQNVLIFRRLASEAEPLLAMPEVETEEETENLFDDINDEKFPEEDETLEKSDLDVKTDDDAEEPSDKKDAKKKSGKKKS